MFKKCLKCFKDYDDKYEDICPYCGFVHTDLKPSTNELCPGVFLHNRYLIGMKIASGGFGIIYEAWDLSLNIVVAIKEYFPVSLATRIIGETNVFSVNRKFEMKYKEGRDRFLYEARMLSKFFEHPNIVKCYDFFEENNTAYIVQEYLTGESVSEILKRKKEGCLLWDESLLIIEGVLNALEAIHKEGLVHRDIAPDNIFIEDNIVKLIDFGAIWPINDKGFQYNKEVVIKSGYAPVEQYNLKEMVGPYTDIYALGATMFRMITGFIPYESTDRESDKNKGNELEKISDRVENISIDISNIVDRMMAVQKEVRFQTIKEVRDALYSEKPIINSLDFEKKLKTRKRTLFVLIGLLSVTFLVFISFIFKEGNKGIKNITVVEDTITVALPYSNELEKGFYENVALSFEKENPKIKVDLKMFTYNDYLGVLSCNPTVFLKNDSISYDKCMDLKELKDSISNKEYLLYDSIGNEYQDKAIPVSFDCNVVYSNRKLVNDQIEELGFDEIKKNNYTLSINPNYLSIVNDKNTLLNSSNDYKQKENFFNGETSLYIGKLSEYREVQSRLIGQYNIIGLNKSQYIEAKDKLSINKKSTKNQQYAGMYFIYYMLSDAAQSPIYINRFSQIDDLTLSFPVNLKTFKRYSTTINDEIGFLNKTLGSAFLYNNKFEEKSTNIEKWILDPNRTEEDLEDLLK